MNEITCPYCGTDQEPDPESYEQDEIHEHDCVECGKTFGFSIFYLPCYEEFELPCANGKPHKWKKIVGVPAEYFRNRRRCEWCGTETVVEDETEDSK